MKGGLTALAVIMGIVTNVALVAQHAIASAADGVRPRRIRDRVRQPTGQIAVTRSAPC